MFKPLDPLLNSELRLAIMSLLIGLEEANFKYLKEHTKATSGNLSIQLQKLKEAGYIEIEKTFRNNYPNTDCKITKKGIEAFDQYVKAIKSYINIKENKMKNILQIFLAFILLSISAYSQDKINTGFGIGIQLVEYQNDFGLGFNLTSPLFLNDKVGVRVKGNFMYNDAVIDGKSDWASYNNVSFGLIGIATNVTDRIRVYGEGGVIAIMPSTSISSNDSEFGGYGLFGFEFFFMEAGNYFIEIGGVGTGARADLIPTEPIYSNGLSISTGFRFFFK